MKTRLNEGKVADLKPKKAGYEVRDEVVRGLVLRVGKKGAKVWEVIVTNGDKRRRQRLGMYPALSVKEARRMAETAKETSRTFTSGNSVKTVADIFEAYKAVRSPMMRTWSDVQSVWDVWASDQIGRIRASDLNVHHGLELRRHVTAGSTAIRAGAVIRYLKPMFAWAAEEHMIEFNPWLNLKVGEKAQSRDYVIPDYDWLALWNSSAELTYPFGPFVQALMLSAQRLSNVAEMRWDEIQGDVWLIPREKVKATRIESAAAHEVPLSTALAALIAQQPRRGPFVFTTSGDKPIVPGSKIKKKLDELAQIGSWRFHDVRRTGATIMTTGNKAGKATRFTVERVLGHSDRTVTATYDRNAYREEKRAALDVLAESVSFGIETHKTDTNVVSVIK